MNFGDAEVSKKEFYESKKAVKLSEVDVNKTPVSKKIKRNNEILCLILPQMGGWIKYFKNGRKNMSLKKEDDIVYLKYNEI